MVDFARFSNSPRANHVTFVVDYTLEGAPRLVRYPAYDPALFVYVLFFGRQVADVADEILAHHLAVLVEGGLDDVAELVDRAPRNQVFSVDALVSRLGGLCLIFFDASGSVRGLVRGSFFPVLGILPGDVRGLVSDVARLIRDFTGLIGGLPGSVAHAFDRPACRIPDTLRHIASTFGNLSDALASLLSRLARACSGFPGSLTCSLSGRLRGLPGSGSSLLGGLAGAFAHLLGGLTGTFANVLDGLAGALDGLSRAFAHILHGGAGTRAYVFHCGACPLAHVLDRRSGARSYVFHCGARARAYILHCGASSRTYVGDGLVRTLANEIARAGTDVLYGRSRPRADIRDRLVGALSYEVSRTRAYVGNRLVSPFTYQITRSRAYVLDRRVDTFAHQLARAFAHVFDGGADALDQLLDDLGVAVYRR
jgi:hypothetical protein